MTNALQLQILRTHERATIPARAYPSDVGWDLHACLISDTGREISRVISPGATVRIPTGLQLAPPPGYYAQIHSRSGLAGASPPVFVPNSPGIVDPGYRGDISVQLYNGGHTGYYVRHGQRIAQLILAHVHFFTMQEVEALPPGDRGESGFGSTGD